jgi:hypothetical protein
MSNGILNDNHRDLAELAVTDQSITINGNLFQTNKVAIVKSKYII